MNKAFALAVILMHVVYGFTNGTLLPQYLCGPANDGLPKSAAQLIPYLKLGELATEWNVFPVGPGTVPVQIFNADTPNTVGAALAPSAGQIIGACHNGYNTSNYGQATSNPVVVVPYLQTSSVTGALAAGFKILPNTIYRLAIVVNNPTFNDAGSALDGALVWASDLGNNQRVGQWINVGPTMTNWSACTLNGKFGSTTGIVHNQVIVEGTNIANLTWKSPASIVGLIQFQGVGITDLGYGTFKTIFNTSKSSAAPPLTTVVRTGNSQQGYFLKEASPDLKQVAATAYRKMTVGTAAGVGIAGVVVGVVAAGAGAVFLIRRKNKKDNSTYVKFF